MSTSDGDTSPCVRALFFLSFSASPCLQLADTTRRSDEKGRNEAARAARAARAAAEREIIGEVGEADELERRRDLTGQQTDATRNNQMPGG